VVKVHCDEGVATHVVPDPCAVAREDNCEASVGERIGQPLSVCCSNTRKESSQ
jgi:hypothetical protein